MNRPKLHIIPGGKDHGYQISSVGVICIADPVIDDSMAKIRVREEDTWQVLSADPSLREVHEHPVRLMTGLIDQKSLTIGDILMKGKYWHIVIYDFDQEPICRATWIEDALQQLLARVSERHVTTLMMPLLGCANHCLTADDSLDMLITNLRNVGNTSLEKLYLECNSADLLMVQQSLQAASDYDPAV